MSVRSAALRIAESPTAYLPLAPGDVRIERPGFVAWLGSGGAHPARNIVQRLRLEGDVDAAIAEVRALLAGHGRPSSTWEIGPSSTPADLAPRLRSHGMVPHELAWGMVADAPLAVTPSEVVAARAETVDDYEAAFELMHRVFGERRAESAEERRARAAQERERHRAGQGALFLGSLAGEPVAAARSVYTDGLVVLMGAATLPHARGRGAYRTLVAARSDDARTRGTPTLVIQAGSMSRPILARLGFETVAEVEVLLDQR